VGKVLTPHNARPKTVPLIKWIKIGVVLKISFFSQIITIKMRLKTNKYIKRNKQENILIKIITINNN